MALVYGLIDNDEKLELIYSSFIALPFLQQV